MRFIFGLSVFGIVALSPLLVAGTELNAKTVALCLAEVVSVEEVNEMPADGNWTVTARLKIIKRSGAAPQQISLVKEYGGKIAPGLEPPPISSLVLVLAKGKRFWLAFSADKEVIGWWPEDAAAGKELEEAVREDQYRGKAREK